jgi:hypothetical protein
MPFRKIKGHELASLAICSRAAAAITISQSHDVAGSEINCAPSRAHSAQGAFW